MRQSQLKAGEHYAATNRSRTDRVNIGPHAYSFTTLLKVEIVETGVHPYGDQYKALKARIEAAGGTWHYATAGYGSRKHGGVLTRILDDGGSGRRNGELKVFEPRQIITEWADYVERREANAEIVAERQAERNALKAEGERMTADLAALGIEKEIGTAAAVPIDRDDLRWLLSQAKAGIECRREQKRRELTRAGVNSRTIESEMQDWEEAQKLPRGN